MIGTRNRDVACRTIYFDIVTAALAVVHHSQCSSGPLSAVISKLKDSGPAEPVRLVRPSPDQLLGHQCVFTAEVIMCIPSISYTNCLKVMCIPSISYTNCMKVMCIPSISYTNCMKVM